MQEESEKQAQERLAKMQERYEMVKKRKNEMLEQAKAKSEDTQMLIKHIQQLNTNEACVPIGFEKIIKDNNLQQYYNISHECDSENIQK